MLCEHNYSPAKSIFTLLLIRALERLRGLSVVLLVVCTCV